MTARTASVIGDAQSPKLQFGERVSEIKTLIIETANTVDATNTIRVNYPVYGITSVIGVLGWKHTTDNSVVVAENPTTTATSAKMIITVPAGTNDDKRIYQLFYT